MNAYEALFNVAGGDIDHCQVYVLDKNKRLNPKKVTLEELKAVDLYDNPIIAFGDGYTYITIYYDFPHAMWIQAIPHAFNQQSVTYVEAG